MEWFLDKNNAVYKTFSEELDIDVVGTPNVGDIINIDSVNSFIYNVKPKTEFGSMMASGTGGDCDFEEVRYMSDVGLSSYEPNRAGINPLQMTHGADWSELTTQNHLSHIWEINSTNAEQFHTALEEHASNFIVSRTSQDIVIGEGLMSQIERDGNTHNYNVNRIDVGQYSITPNEELQDLNRLYEQARQRNEG